MINRKTSQEMNYLTYFLITFRHKIIKDYIRNKELSDLYHILPLMQKEENFPLLKKTMIF